MESFILLFLDKREELSELFIQHMNMTAIAVFISLMIGVPLGIIVTKHKRLADFVIGFANVLQSIPSIALLAFAVPFVGIGERPAILMVIVYSLLPILKNTYTGIKGIDPKMLEFSIYNDIPHLLTPVITDPKKAVNALSNMVAEMERRYRLMADAKTKNIEKCCFIPGKNAKKQN